MRGRARSRQIVWEITLAAIASSFAKPSSTAPSSPIGPASALGQLAWKTLAPTDMPPAIAIAPRPYLRNASARCERSARRELSCGAGAMLSWAVEAAIAIGAAIRRLVMDSNQRGNQRAILGNLRGAVVTLSAGRS